VLSNLIRIPGWGSILLDAGEGTWGQLVRQFGLDVYEVLRDIRCIFVSHVHADHHLGTATLLAQRSQVCIHLLADQLRTTYLCI
jgi:ribonuclease Z